MRLYSSYGLLGDSAKQWTLYIQWQWAVKSEQHTVVSFTKFKICISWNLAEILRKFDLVKNIKFCEKIFLYRPDQILEGCHYVTVNCPLSTVHCPLFTAHSPLSTAHFPLSSVHCPMATVCCPLFTAHCLLPTADCPQLIVHCSLPTVLCLLAVVHCQLSTVHGVYPLYLWFY
jgi:hypothetical protein